MREEWEFLEWLNMFMLPDAEGFFVGRMIIGRVVFGVLSLPMVPKLFCPRAICHPSSPPSTKTLPTLHQRYYRGCVVWSLSNSNNYWLASTSTLRSCSGNSVTNVENKQTRQNHIWQKIDMSTRLWQSEGWQYSPRTGAVN